MSKRHHRVAVGRRQGGQHLRPRSGPGAGCRQSGATSASGHQHEGAVLQARMRQDQPVRRRRGLRVRGKVAPVRPAWRHRAAPDRPAREGRGPASASPSAASARGRTAPRSGAAEPELPPASSLRRGIQHGSRVHIIRPGPRRKAGRRVKPADCEATGRPLRPKRTSAADSVSAGGRRRIRQIRAQCDQCVYCSLRVNQWQSFV